MLSGITDRLKVLEQQLEFPLQVSFNSSGVGEIRTKENDYHVFTFRTLDDLLDKLNWHIAQNSRNPNAPKARYHISWNSALVDAATPFQYWCIGWATNDFKWLTYNAVIDTSGSNDYIVYAIRQFFPDAKMRYIEPCNLDFVPSRLAHFENRTSLEKE